jgi:hypothetical protein
MIHFQVYTSFHPARTDPKQCKRGFQSISLLRTQRMLGFGYFKPPATLF